VQAALAPSTPPNECIFSEVQVVSDGLRQKRTLRISRGRLGVLFRHFVLLANARLTLGNGALMRQLQASQRID
jgi:hypothetical protein